MSNAQIQIATVTATYSRRMGIRLENGDSAMARIKGKTLKVVCGDQVQVEPITDETDWLITRIEERDSALTRPNKRGNTDILAANFNLVAVVTAPEPAPDWFIVDRYIAAAEAVQASVVLVLNKTDILQDDAEASIEAELNNYARCGYPVIRCSAETGNNTDQLLQALQQHTAIFVGQSGVGKSSLVNSLIQDSDQAVGELTRASREGKHTTVNSKMLELKDGGCIIDSPGVRDYAPAVSSPALVQQGFIEINEYAANCRFANCRHLQEPQCAVKQAVEENKISERRYESYRRLLRLTERLLTASAP